MNIDVDITVYIDLYRYTDNFAQPYSILTSTCCSASWFVVFESMHNKGISIQFELFIVMFCLVYVSHEYKYLPENLSRCTKFQIFKKT